MYIPVTKIVWNVTVANMIKPKTKLKNRVGKILNILSTFPQEKVPKLENGGLDVVAFNAMPEIISAKEDIVRNSFEILGENVISREWLGDNGYLVAALILDFKNFTSEIEKEKQELDYLQQDKRREEAEQADRSERELLDND